MVLPLFFPAVLILRLQVWKRRRTERGNVLRLIQDRLSDAEFGKNLANLSNQFAASANDRFQFQKRSQLFIRSHNETLSVAPMRIHYERLFVHWNPRLRHSPNSNRLC
jgi:hypothetical protein